MLKIDDYIGIVACSNGLNENMSEKLELLYKKIENLGLKVKKSPFIFAKEACFSGTGKERAIILNEFFRDDSIKAIFDISGGDLANELLEHINFEMIKEKNKPFFGYSDLSVILNAIYAKTGVETYNYQIRNLIGEFSRVQLENFKNSLMERKDDLFKVHYDFIQGTEMEGIVVGGNIRCCLKLVGTEYMPDFTDKIIFLEGLSGDVGKMTTFLTQYKNIGAFKECKGILLGTFTEMEKNKYEPNIVELVKRIVNNDSIPIAKTSEIGHGEDSKSIIVGRNIRVEI